MRNGPSCGPSKNSPSITKELELHTSSACALRLTEPGGIRRSSGPYIDGYSQPTSPGTGYGMTVARTGADLPPQNGRMPSTSRSSVVARKNN